MQKTFLAVALLSLVGGSALLAAETSVVIRDVTGRGFPPDLVHYRLEGDAERAAAVRLVDAGRAVVPSQVRLGDDGRPELWLVTSLPANGTVSLAVRSDASVAQPQTPVAVTAGTDGSELTNGVFTVRCPAAGETHFDPPVPASQLPAPIRCIVPAALLPAPSTASDVADEDDNETVGSDGFPL